MNDASSTATAADDSWIKMVLEPAGVHPWAAARGTLTIGPKSTVRMGVVLAVAVNCSVAEAAAVATAANFSAEFEQSPVGHEAHWAAAFTPGNTDYSGNFPVLETADGALARTYYGSLMSMMLAHKRGLNYDYTVSAPTAVSQPKPLARSAAGGFPATVAAAASCRGLYVAIHPGDERQNHGSITSAPFQLLAPKAHSRAGGFVARQFYGRINYSWRSADATGALEKVSIEFDNGKRDTGAVLGDCHEIIWTSGSRWTRIRPDGAWNMFVSAGALLGNTAFYLWDTSGASLLWALLDPDGLRVANDIFASADPLLKNACDYITMAETGKYYAFSPVSAFMALANELRVGGPSVARRRMALSNRSVAEQLAATALVYNRLPTFDGTSLPDWGGGSSAFLECEQTYSHGVAALQASEVWMLREAAAVLRAAAVPDANSSAVVARMEAAASTLLAEMMPQLRLDKSSKLGGKHSRDDGWWWMLHPKGPLNHTPVQVEVSSACR